MLDQIVFKADLLAEEYKFQVLDLFLNEIYTCSHKTAFMYMYDNTCLIIASFSPDVITTPRGIQSVEQLVQ